MGSLSTPTLDRGYTPAACDASDPDCACHEVAAPPPRARAALSPTSVQLNVHLTAHRTAGAPVATAWEAQASLGLGVVGRAHGSTWERAAGEAVRQALRAWKADRRVMPAEVREAVREVLTGAVRP